jgi:hypothetical protein
MRPGFSISGKKSIAQVGALVAIATGVFAPPATATGPGANGTLAFTSYNSTDHEYSVALRTSQGLTTTVPDRALPFWTFDGSGLVMPRPSDSKLFLHAPDGTGGTELGAQDPGSAAIPIGFLPDGRLLYGVPGGSGYEIRARAADGTDTLLRTVVSGLNATLSPDGNQLAYLRSTPGQKCAYNVEVLTLSSGAVRPLGVACDPDTNPSPPPGSGPYFYEQVAPVDWSPDGQRILVVRSKYHCACVNQTSTVESVDAANGGAPVVHATADVTAGGSQGSYLEGAAFSPDGRFVAYTSDPPFVGAPGTPTISYAALGSAPAPASFTVPDSDVLSTLKWQPLPVTISGPLGPTSETSPTFEIKGTGPFECRLDSGSSAGTWASCSSPHQLSGLSLGRYDLLVRPSGSTAPATAQSFVVVETAGSGTPPEEGEVSIPQVDLGLFVGQAVDASLLEAIDAAQGLSDGLDVDGTAPVPGTMDIDISTSNGPGSGRAQRAGESAVLASGSASVGPGEGNSVNLELGPAAAALKRSHRIATPAQVTVRFTGADGTVVSHSANTTAVLAAGQRLRSLSLRDYTAKPKGKLRASIRARGRSEFNASIVLADDGRGKKRLTLGRARVRHGRATSKLKLPSSVRPGSYRLLAAVPRRA